MTMLPMIYPVRLLGMLVLAAALLLGGCADVSEDAYERIQVGMAIAEVQNIMGTEGKREEQRGFSISAGGVASTQSNHRDEIFTWESGRQRITVHTRNGVVTSKFKEGF
jgi:mannose-6-phosphate isomerase-like protein (cupin superfamily)